MNTEITERIGVMRRATESARERMGEVAGLIVELDEMDLGTGDCDWIEAALLLDDIDRRTAYARRQMARVGDEVVDLHDRAAERQAQAADE